jgi:HlyD family secretion protein
MTANVTFGYAERADVLRLPSAALRFRPPPGLLDPGGGDGRKKNKQAKLQRQAKHEADQADPTTDAGGHRGAERRSVWVLRGGIPAELSVEVGISDGSRVELLAGDLREGDALVTDAFGSGKESLLQAAPAKKSKKLF